MATKATQSTKMDIEAEPDYKEVKARTDSMRTVSEPVHQLMSVQLARFSPNLHAVIAETLRIAKELLKDNYCLEQDANWSARERLLCGMWGKLRWERGDKDRLQSKMASLAKAVEEAADRKEAARQAALFDRAREETAAAHADKLSTDDTADLEEYSEGSDGEGEEPESSEDELQVDVGNNAVIPGFTSGPSIDPDITDTSNKANAPKRVRVAKKFKGLTAWKAAGYKLSKKGAEFLKKDRHCTICAVSLQPDVNAALVPRKKILSPQPECWSCWHAKREVQHQGAPSRHLLSLATNRGHALVDRAGFDFMDLGEDLNQLHADAVLAALEAADPSFKAIKGIGQRTCISEGIYRLMNAAPQGLDGRSAFTVGRTVIERFDDRNEKWLHVCRRTGVHVSWSAGDGSTRASVDREILVWHPSWKDAYSYGYASEDQHLILSTLIYNLYGGTASPEERYKAAVADLRGADQNKQREYWLNFDKVWSSIQNIDDADLVIKNERDFERIAGQVGQGLQARSYKDYQVIRQKIASVLYTQVTAATTGRGGPSTSGRGSTSQRFYLNPVATLPQMTLLGLYGEVNGMTGAPLPLEARSIDAIHSAEGHCVGGVFVTTTPQNIARSTFYWQISQRSCDNWLQGSKVGKFIQDSLMAILDGEESAEEAPFYELGELLWQSMVSFLLNFVEHGRKTWPDISVDGIDFKALRASLYQDKKA